MELTQEQKKIIAEWVAEGKSLAQIQEGIAADFGQKLTYMDVRFLIEDLEIEFPSESQETPEENSEKEENTATPEADDPEAVELEDAGFDAQAGAGRVQVDVDKLTRPGAMISGTVTFSDGENSVWMLDQMGQVRLMPSKEGYQPSQDDIEAFQVGLRDKLSKQGL